MLEENWLGGSSKLENEEKVLFSNDKNTSLWFEEKLDEIIENIKTEIKHSFEINQKELSRLEKFIKNIYEILEDKNLKLNPDLEESETIKEKLRFISILLISYEKKLSLSSDLFDTNQKILNLLQNN